LLLLLAARKKKLPLLKLLRLPPLLLRLLKLLPLLRLLKLHRLRLLLLLKPHQPSNSALNKKARQTPGFFIAIFWLQSESEHER
jgi:hypothetical protein